MPVPANGKFAMLAKRKSLSDHAYDSIFNLILAGNVRPGQRLNELEIATEMGISRAPVREAFQRLREKGLVMLLPGRGPAVVELSIEQVREVYEVRVAMEQLALRLIPQSHYQSLVDELKRVVANIRDLARRGEVAKVVDEEIRFHGLIVTAAGNRLLSDLYGQLIARMRMILAVDKSFFVELEDVAVDHEQILKAFEQGDLEQTQALLANHIWESLPIIEKHPAFAPGKAAGAHAS